MPIIADQPILKTIQSVVRTMIGLHIAVDRRQHDARNAELLRARLASVGDLLLAALRVELEYSEIDLSQALPEELEQWRECRLKVEELTEDYISLIAEWREALAAGCRANNHRAPRYH